MKEFDLHFMWNNNSGSSYWASPSAGIDGMIIAPSLFGDLFALNRYGEELWLFSVDGYIATSPAIDKNGNIYFGTSVFNSNMIPQPSKFFSLTPEGNIRWQIDTQTLVMSSPVIGYDENKNMIIYYAEAFIDIHSDERRSIFNAIDSNGNNLWELSIDAWIISTPVISEYGNIYVGIEYCPGMYNFFEFNCDNSKGGIIGIDKNGKLLGKFPTDGGVMSSPVILSDGTIVFGANDDYIYAVKENYSNGGIAKSPWPKLRHDERNSAYHKSAITGIINEEICDGVDNDKDTNIDEVYCPDKTFSEVELSLSGNPNNFEDKQIYFTSFDSNLYCLDNNGNLLWVFDLEASSHSTPVIDNDGIIYVGTGTKLPALTYSMAKVFAINSDGSMKWTKSIDFNYDNNDLDFNAIYILSLDSNGNIYFGDCKNAIYSLNTENGDINWSYETHGEVKAGIAIGNDNTLYVGDIINNENNEFTGTFYALNPNGTLLWSKDFDSPIYSSAAIGQDGTIYFGTENRFYAYTPSGQQKWIAKEVFDDNSDMEIIGPILNSPALDNDQNIYITAAESLYAIESNGHVKWKFSFGKQFDKNASSPIIDCNNIIYIGSSNNIFYAIGIDGNLKWRFKATDKIDNSAVFLSNKHKIFIGSFNKQIHSFITEDCIGNNINWSSFMHDRRNSGNYNTTSE